MGKAALNDRFRAAFFKLKFQIVHQREAQTLFSSVLQIHKSFQSTYLHEVRFKSVLLFSEDRDVSSSSDTRGGEGEPDGITNFCSSHLSQGEKTFGPGNSSLTYAGLRPETLRRGRILT